MRLIKIIIRNSTKKYAFVITDSFKFFEIVLHDWTTNCIEWIRRSSERKRKSNYKILLQKKKRKINNRLRINKKELYTNAEQASQSKKIYLLR